MKRARPGKSREVPYPLVKCDDHHGDPLPGYVVCKHAIADPTVQLGPIERASATDVGVVVCSLCALDMKNIPVDRLVTACAHFVNETFGVPL